MAPGFMPDAVNGLGKVDPFSANGADHWYTMPNQRVRAINNDLAQKTFLPGWLRAVGPGWIGWGIESFMDELAVQTGQDPIEMRIAMLDGAIDINSSTGQGSKIDFTIPISRAGSAPRMSPTCAACRSPRWPSSG